MKCFVIVIPNHIDSMNAFDKLRRSSESVGNDFDIEIFPAVTPDNVVDHMRKNKVRWNYPTSGSVYDESTKITKTAYAGTNHPARISCAMSHYEVWKYTSEQKEPTLILEHDAIFVSKLDIQKNFPIIGINNPLGATRKARLFHNKVQSSNSDYPNAPWIDDKKIPQGLAGHSAYIIQPSAAQTMLELVDKYGLWPNDAIMCRQLFDDLYVSKKYYTQIQKGIQSTTKL